jgi:hypothetical protein
VETYQLRDPKRGVIGPFRLQTVREMIAGGLLDPKAEVALEKGPFVPIQELDRIVPPPPWFRLETGVLADWRNIGVLRASLLGYLSTVFQDKAVRDSVTMVLGELMENACKYGQWDRPGQSMLRVVVEGDAYNGVQIQVWNPVDVQGTHLRRLRLLVDRSQRSRDAFEAYRAKLSEIASEPPRTDGVGGLGLYRIAYEASCELYVELEKDDLVRVDAFLRQTQAPPEPGGG